MTRRKTQRDVFHEEMLNAVLTSLEKEIIPWEKPWESINGIPLNAVTNQPYQGMNSFNLMMRSMELGLTDPRWCTFNQANKEGWRIKKGSKSSKIYFVSVVNKETNKPITAKDFEGLTEEEKTELRAKAKPVFKTYTVFNGDQIEGIPELTVEQKIHYEFNDEKTQKYLDDLKKGMEIEVEYGGGRAFYSPLNDKVTLPQRDDFKSYQGYVETYLHEFAHATGHSKRLNRDLTGRFGTRSYSKEELIAELTSMMLSIDLGIVENERQIENTKAYCQSWHQVLKSTPKLLEDVVDEMYKARNYMHEKGAWVIETTKNKPLDVNVDTLRSSVLIQDYAHHVLGFETVEHSRGTLRLMEHDSCVIYPDQNSFHRYSSDKGGDIYDFVMEFEGVSFKEAFEKVKTFYEVHKPELVEGVKAPKFKLPPKELELPEKAKDNNKAIDYLVNQRGLDVQLVNEFIEKGMIYQDVKNNVVFVGYDNRTPSYASRRSTYSDFKGDAKGSRKEVGFFIDNDSDTLVLTESPIDALSYMQLKDGDRSVNHLAVGGVGGALSTFKHYIENNPNAIKTRNVVIAFDSDEAGRNASEMIEGYIGYYYNMNVEIVEPELKDFNQDLLQLGGVETQESIKNLESTTKEEPPKKGSQLGKIRQYQAQINQTAEKERASRQQIQSKTVTKEGESK